MKRYILIIMILLFVLTGCSGVEPERRVYPLVIGIDRKEEQYQLYLGMANLSSATGQDKSNEAGTSGQTLLLQGESIEEIFRIYDQTQDKYLDLGHIQAVIFGDVLLQQPQSYDHVLRYLENEPAIGDSVAVFQSSKLKKIMELNNLDAQSLGMYLTGLYENRFYDQKREMVTLRAVYYDWHEEKKIRELPMIDIEKDFPKVSE